MKIDLYNRYGDKIWLESENSNNDTFILNGVLDYTRVIFGDAALTKIDAIDPPGGPFMEINNFSIENNSKILYDIKEIESGKFRLYFKTGQIKTNK